MNIPTNKGVTKTKLISGIFRDNFDTNLFHLPWLTTIAEEDFTKGVICIGGIGNRNGDSRTSCSGNAKGNIPVDILAATS